MKRRAALLLAAASLAGCSSLLPDKPRQSSVYDLGLPAAPAGSVAPGAPALILGDIDTSAALEGTAMLYRLAYADPHELLPYSIARWSSPPAQLVRQRLRERLGRDRPVIDGGAAASLARRSTAAPRVLRVELEEFSQVFDSQAASRGVVRLRCTLFENSAAGERLLAQRSVVADRPAPSADAAGGVRALAAASEAAAEELAAWVRQQP